jgi:hypothetical protein
MRMLIAALIGGAVLGFVEAKFLASKLQELTSDPGTQGILTASVAAFLGAVWGWMAKSVLGNKPKE